MAMTRAEALDLLPQIETLVADRCQVVSYKWLSRNFLLSSNSAKWLLHEFVQNHKNELQVVYTVSGWLKNNTQNYCVKLALGSKLEETQKQFMDGCSVQVYSVQVSLPKDTAVLWNVEFAQAEELFNRPPAEDNCLRDNRFCGISNSSVKRTADSKQIPIRLQKPINGIPQAAQTSNIKKELYPDQQAANSMQGTTKSTEKSNILVTDKISKPATAKEPSDRDQTGKVKAQNVKALSESSRSLATMWGCASTKGKSLNVATKNADSGPNNAVSADAQVQSHEADFVSSDEEEQTLNLKRESSSTSNRKRRVVFDSDDEDNVISLASPDLPKDHVSKLSSINAQSKMNEAGGVSENKELVDNINDNINESKTECLLPADNCRSLVRSAGISLKEKPHVSVTNNAKQDHKSESGSGSPKRRKVFRTRIDERGREVSEVVWETEESSSNKTDKNTGSTDWLNRAPSVAKLQQTSGADTTERNTLASKAAGGNKKPGKAGAKDTKQGNIMSFFKKI